MSALFGRSVIEKGRKKTVRRTILTK